MGKLEKISAWNLTKVRSKKEVIKESRTAGATVHFASLMDICHLKNAKLEAKHQKYKGRVVLLGVVVKDDSGSPGGWGPQGRPRTGGGGLARVPNLRVCDHPFNRRVWHTQGKKDELTSCRGTVQSAWQKPPVSRKGGGAGLPARVSGRHEERGNRQAPPILEVRPGDRQGW